MKPLKRAVGILVRHALGHGAKRKGRDNFLDELQLRIGYTFKNQSLLRQALTHISWVSGERARNHIRSNERLEFLGDAVLNCCVTDYLFKTYPNRSEGQLSKIKSLIVSRKILSEIAQRIGLGLYLLLGESENESGGRYKPSIVSNAFEAVIGAMYLDGGMKNVYSFLKRFLFPYIEQFLSESSNINYKSKILEMAQRDGLGIPRYTVISSYGPEHAKMFEVQIEIAGIPLGKGSGPNKKIAEQKAAQAAAERYDKDVLMHILQGAQKHELVLH